MDHLSYQERPPDLPEGIIGFTKRDHWSDLKWPLVSPPGLLVLYIVYYLLVEWFLLVIPKLSQKFPLSNLLSCVHQRSIEVYLKFWPKSFLRYLVMIKLNMKKKETHMYLHFSVSNYYLLILTNFPQLCSPEGKPLSI